MRISTPELKQLKNTILSLKPEAKVYLFGSRVHDDQRGGDIDILILTEHKLTFAELSTIRWAFYEKFGEQKLDLVNFCFDDDDPFKTIALREAKEI
jgi:predicted nucleotidyltransferase